jgi:hypothetical protein
MQRGPGPMMAPPSQIPNFSLPPPGFPPQFSSDNASNVQSSAQGGQQNSDSNQELWVETKSADGKVMKHKHMFTTCSLLNL